jgi:hypothetical protein
MVFEKKFWKNWAEINPAAYTKFYKKLPKPRKEEK